MCAKLVARIRNIPIAAALMITKLSFMLSEGVLVASFIILSSPVHPTVVEIN